MQNGSAVLPPNLMGVAQYGLLQKHLGPPRGDCAAFRQCYAKRARGAAANFDWVGPIWLFTKLNDGPDVQGLLEAIVLRFWECDAKRAHAAATNFDGGGPMWPITKAWDAERGGGAELSHQMCKHFPHHPHHRHRRLVADAELGSGGLQNETTPATHAAAPALVRLLRGHTPPPTRVRTRAAARSTGTPRSDERYISTGLAKTARDRHFGSAVKAPLDRRHRSWFNPVRTAFIFALHFFILFSFPLEHHAADPAASPSLRSGLGGGPTELRRDVPRDR
ncbi:hypothetical protein B0H10DRAFT_1946852 [Mycena sp. CBHHK59/15]|nr:hypothetical protein B0H10DRAFT_1946852 [Mycena sp. CBHHK59/15]